MNMFGRMIGEIKIKQSSTQTLSSVGKLMLVRQSLNHPSLQIGNIRKDIGGGILAAEIRCDSFVFQVVNVYAFPSSYSKQKREGFFNQIYDFANINLTKILCGDFNCVENPTLDRHPAKNSINTESKQLTKFVQICRMFDCAAQLQQTKHTFFSEFFRARELIAFMHLMTSTWFLCVFRLITFQITTL